MTTISRPSHKRYALAHVSNDVYINFLNGYSISKKTGVKGVWLFLAGNGLYSICYEVLKGRVKTWGRRRLGVGIIACLTYMGTPAVPLITNSTRIIRAANFTHTVISSGFEVCEDISTLSWIPLDFALFGQIVPIGDGGRYNLMGGCASLLDDIMDGE